MVLPVIEPEFRRVPLGLIDAPEVPSRSTMSDEKMDELVASIKHLGLLEPMMIFPVNDRYQIIAGHRRWHACQRAGLAVAPCMIYPSEAEFREAMQFGENRHREDLNAADEAIWFSELLESRCGGDVDLLCARLGEKRAYVEGRLLLFSGDELVFDRLKRGLIPIGVAQALNKCTDEAYRRSFLHNAIVGGATVAVVNGWVMQWRRDQALIVGGASAPAPAVPSGPVLQTNFFRCYVCEGEDNVHLMQPVNIHTHCRMAILDKMLAAARGER